VTRAARRYILFAFPFVTLAVLFFARDFWLTGLGRFLVRSEEPFRADIVVVLAGDDRGNRILKGAELVRQGYAPRVLVSGPPCCYGAHESDLAIPFAVKHGYPVDWFVPLRFEGFSTKDEARAVMAELKRLRVRRFLVVTSDYHTRRAGSIYRALAPPGSFRMIAAPDWAFTPDGWWRTREGEKQAFYEWMKTFANWGGL
jgi:uncharacterized SAM-binding protein YcdF (DUF218 family)